MDNKMLITHKDLEWFRTCEPAYLVSEQRWAAGSSRLTRCILLRAQSRAPNRRVKPSLGWRRKSTRWRGLLNRWRAGEDLIPQTWLPSWIIIPINCLFTEPVRTSYSPVFLPLFSFFMIMIFYFFYWIKTIWTVRNIWWSRPETWTQQQGSCCSCSSSPHLPDI